MDQEHAEKLALIVAEKSTTNCNLFELTHQVLDAYNAAFKIIYSNANEVSESNIEE
jgi:hypothetical protein